jgi:FkbM family methyltransferase
MQTPKFLNDILWHYLLKRGYRVRWEEPDNRIDLLGVLVEKEFAGKGAFLLQIGCNDGVTFDPIHSHIKRGWTGLLVEPLTKQMEQLKDNRKAFDFKYAKCVVTDKVGTVSLTTDDDTLAAKVGTGRGITEEVKSYDLASLLKSQEVKPEQVDIMLTDAEGWDCSIINQIVDIPNLRPKIIQFEYSFIQQYDWLKLCSRLEKAGYNVIISLYKRYADTICLRS